MRPAEARASVTGADLLWLMASNVVLAVREQCPEGSYLREITRRQAPCVWERVRVVKYTIADHENAGPVRLITTILNPDQALAAELAALHHERREVEGHHSPSRCI